MGTRLFAEKIIKQNFPEIKYLRVHTTGKAEATIYAWDKNLDINDHTKMLLSEFGNNEILAHVKFVVKGYDQTKTDQIPENQVPPEVILNAAYSGGLNKQGIVNTIKEVFPEIELIYKGYDFDSGKVNFTVTDSDNFTPIERELLEQYLFEIIPLGSTPRVQYLRE